MALSGRPLVRVGSAVKVLGSSSQVMKLNGSSPSGNWVLMGTSARKLSTLVSREPAKVGSLLSREASAAGVHVLTPAVPNRSSNGSVSALAAGASPISAAAKAAPAAITMPVGFVMILLLLDRPSGVGAPPPFDGAAEQVQRRE